MFGRKKKETTRIEFPKDDTEQMDEKDLNEMRYQPEEEQEEQEIKRKPGRLPMQKSEPIIQEDSPIWSVQNFSVQPSEQAIYNSETKKSYTILQALVEILNRTEQ